MLKYTITSNSRGIILEFTAEQDLAKTHKVQVKATHLANKYTWTFTYKSVLIVSESDVIKLAKNVVSNRTKTFWTIAAEAIKKEITEKQEKLANTIDFFDYQARGEGTEESFENYWSRVGKQRMVEEYSSYFTVVRCVSTLIALL